MSMYVAIVITSSPGGTSGNTKGRWRVLRQRPLVELVGQQMLVDGRQRPVTLLDEAETEK